MSIRITLRQAEALVALFGGADTEMTVTDLESGRISDQGETLPPGLYAFCSEYPEEGAVYLGPTEVQDDDILDGPAIGERNEVNEQGMAAPTCLELASDQRPV